MRLVFFEQGLHETENIKIKKFYKENSPEQAKLEDEHIAGNALFTKISDSHKYILKLRVNDSTFTIAKRIYQFRNRFNARAIRSEIRG